MGHDNSLSVSICILTYNRCLLLRELLTELKAIVYKPLELIVVDNHSEDETQEMLETLFPTIKYIRTEKNIGAAGRNIAMKVARGDIVVTLDDDIRGLGDSAIEVLVRKFIEDP